MNLKSLPEESDLRRFRDSRALMSHVDELRELLPDTDMNRRVLSALAMLNRDRQLSRNREPCKLPELRRKDSGDCPAKELVDGGAEAGYPVGTCTE